MLGLCLAFLAANSVPQLTSVMIDLRQRGYRADPLIASYGEIYPPSHLLSIYASGDVAAGFITRGDDLATREHPSLILQVAVFDRDGKFLRESGFPTTMWQDNGIWAVDPENLVVRTPQALSVNSRQGEVLATRDRIDPHTYVKASPNRQNMLLLLPRREMQLILTRDSKVLRGCLDHRGITSIADYLALRFLRSGPTPAIQVEEVCGAVRFEYSWADRDVRDAILLDDTRFVIRSQHAIAVVDRDKRVWSDSFAKSEAVQGIESDERGDTIAVAVAKYVGGSQLLDVNGHLKVMKIILYRATDGKRTAELVVEHPPRLPFNFFALSPDGSVLAVLSDGFLQIAEVKASATVKPP